MRATRGIRQSLRAPVLFAAAAGLALSASGCIIDSSSGGCSPDLTIPWRIISNLDGAEISCAEATADTVTAWIDGGGIGATPAPFSQVCGAINSQGSIVALLPTSGSYGVSVELTSGGVNG